MSYPYAKAIPTDRNQNPLQEYPAPAISLQTFTGVPTSSSVVGLTDGTTVVEISAQGGNGILLKWGPNAVTTSNFDHLIQPGATRRFVVPASVQGTASIAGINTMSGLYNKVAFITAGAASSSVLSTEY